MSNTSASRDGKRKCYSIGDLEYVGSEKDLIIQQYKKNGGSYPKQLSTVAVLGSQLELYHVAISSST